MSTASTCSCGTFAIGVCTACERTVCGERDCSGRLEGRMLCISCLRSTVAFERAEREEAAQRTEAERLAWEVTPVDMSERQAFLTMFLSEPDVRHVNTAEEILISLGSARFEDLALQCLVSEGVAGEPFESSEHQGSTRGIIGKSLRSMRSYRAWTFQNYAVDDVLGWSLSTDRVWRQSYSGGEGWQSYSGTMRVNFDDDLLSTIVRRRAAMLRRVIGTSIAITPGIVGSRR